METMQATTTFLTTDQFLEHWQGHRTLTRHVIEAFPEEHLFTFSVGGMRPLSELAKELITIAYSGVNGMITKHWDSWEQAENSREWPTTKAGLLELWDQMTEEINSKWPQIPAERFTEKLLTFGQWESIGYSAILYWIDNEVHHRAQAYVYLRALGIEPPGFWVRW